MQRARLLAHTLVELADTLVADYDVVEFLYLLCDRAVELLEADAAGVLLMNSSGGLEVAASSSSDLHSLEKFEVQTKEGPCVLAHRSGSRVEAEDLLDHAEQWPAFVEHAAARGLRSVHSRPLRLRAQHIGALNVFRERPGPFSDEDAVVAGALATMASIGMVHQRVLTAAEEQITQLQHALDSRIVIEQASAVLADREGIDTGEAFGRLRRYARDNNQRLHAVARRFLDRQIDTGSFGVG
ncbi:MAG TPA: GAF and ANTAR domain-containing protein [Egibacteraceae bacterium]|nr:GAF and ANTAR domain-containing protein [Egibacteraceae bacterium]